MLICLLADAQKPAEPETDAALCERILRVPIRFGGFDDPETQLDDVLQYLARAYHVDFVIDEKAFKADGVDDLRKRVLGMAVPGMRGVPLNTVLKNAVLSNIPSKTPAIWVVQRGRVVLTTTREWFIRLLPL
jgi:hypothetical protein